VQAGAFLFSDAHQKHEAFRERHYRIRDLARLWALSEETVRLLVKDEPDEVKIWLGRKQAYVTNRHKGHI
jgi:hypothetical protein